MSINIYAPFTAKEVAYALKIVDCEELAGDRIAGDMLEGVVPFTEEELEKLAVFKGIVVDELTELDERFLRYAKPERVIAKRLVDMGMDAGTVAEICGVDINTIKRG